MILSSSFPPAHNADATPARQGKTASPNGPKTIPPPGTASTIDLRLYGENWIVICDRGSGKFGGQPYTGLHAIFMRAESEKIAEFREYFGELPG